VLSLPVFQAASDQSLLVKLGDEVSLPAHRRVVQLLHAMEEACVQGVVNLHPAYCSLLIRFDSLVASHAGLEAKVLELIESTANVEPTEPRVVEIPVRYGGDAGWDLAEVAEICRLSIEEVIELHASPIYTVYFLGFVPGFAYLGRLPERLMVPRLDRPRKHVPAGSVAIANDHTAIYSIGTPGGWRVIGRTEMQLFDAQRQNLSLLKPGDQVRFRPL